MAGPLNFNAFLGWVNVTDPNNIPPDARVLSADDLLRYEKLGIDAATAVNDLSTKVDSFDSDPTIAGLIAAPDSATRGAVETMVEGSVDGLQAKIDAVPATVTAKLNTDVPPAVASAIAADSTIQTAATTAVNTKVAGLNLVTSTDPRLDVPIATDPNYSHVEVDADGNVIMGFKNDGSTFIRTLTGVDFLSGTDPRLPQTTIDVTGWDTIEVDADEDVISGIKTDGTYYFRKIESPSIGASTLAMKIAGYGDSMFGDHGGTGVSTLSALELLSGVEVYKGGIPGQTSTEAALRQGGLDIFVTVTGNSIPASGAVAVTVVQPVGTWQSSTAWNFTGSLAGIPGTLRKEIGNTWNFTRTATGAVTAVKAETRWVSDLARPTWINIFRAGKNQTVAASIKRDYQAAFNGLSGENSHRILMLPVYNSTTEPAGSANYTTLMGINADLEATYGPHYYDLRGWLIRNGLTEAGITPTAADTAAIAQDCIPPSLMFDNTHLTALGRQVEAARILHILKTKGWLV